MKMYMAMMESESYTWIAFGSTAHKAKMAIKRKWDKHPYTYKMTLKELEEEYGIKILEVAENKCYLDFEE